MNASNGLAVLAALALMACNASGTDADTDTGPACLPTVEDGWVRSPPAAMPMAGGFARISNACDAPATIVSAASDAFEAVELHETTAADGVHRMREVPALEVRARDEVALQPGGLHLMLMRPLRELAPGDAVAVEFELDDGRGFAGTFEVRAAADGHRHGHSGH